MPSKFTQFFKREFGPYFRDFSEYDFRFFRTLRDVFVRPNKVIEANDGTYTGELKFTFNVFTLLFLAHYFLSPSWIGDIGVYQSWKYTLPHQEYLQLQQGIEEDYYGYITAIAFIPAYFISLKLLFYKRKPWGYFLSAAFYLTSVIFCILIGFILVFDLIGPDFDPSLIIAAVMLLCVCLPVVMLRIQHWFISLVKGVVAGAFSFFIMSAALEDQLFNYASNLLSDRPALEMKSEDSLVVFEQELEFDSDGMQQVIMKAPRTMHLLDYDYINYYEKGSLIWQNRFPNHNPRRMKTIGANVLISSFMEEEKQVELSLLDTKGDTLLSQQAPYEGKRFLSSFQISDDAFVAYLDGQSFSFTYINGDWIMRERENYKREFVSYTYQQLDPETIIRTAVEMEKHVTKMEVQGLNLSDSIVWSHTMYNKNSPFDPLDLLNAYPDSASGMVYTFYTLANDSTYITHLSAIDSKTGSLEWKSDISLPVDVTELEGLWVADDYLYLYGEAHKFYSEWFWQPTYHIGLIVKLDRNTGEYLKHIFLGPDYTFDSHSKAHDMMIQNDTLFLVSFDQHRDALLDIGDEEAYLMVKGIPANF